MYKCGSVILIQLSTRQAWTTTHVKWYPSLHCIVTPSDFLQKKHFESDWIRWEQPFWRSPNEPLPQSRGYQLLSIPCLGKFWKWNSTAFKEPCWEFSLCIPLFENNFSCCYTYDCCFLLLCCNTGQYCCLCISNLSYCYGFIQYLNSVRLLGSF